MTLNDLNQDFKVTPLFSAELHRNDTIYQLLIATHALLKPQGCYFE